MFRNFKLKMLFLLLIGFISSLIFFTNIYLNIFKGIFEDFIASTLAINKVEYDYVEGNLIKGFYIKNLMLYSDDYTFFSETTKASIKFNDIFNSFSDVKFVKFKKVSLTLANSGKESLTNPSLQESSLLNLTFFQGLPISFISLIDFNISYKEEQLFFDKLTIRSDSEMASCSIDGEGKGFFSGYTFSVDKIKGELSLFKNNISLNNLKITYEDNNAFFEDFDIFFEFEDSSDIRVAIESKGEMTLIGYNFTIESFNIARFDDTNYGYGLTVGAFDSDYFSFEKITSSGPMDSGDVGLFNIKELVFLNEDFYEIKGDIKYLNDSIYLRVPYLEREKEISRAKKSILGLDLQFYDTFVDINNLKFKINNFPPLILVDRSICSILNRELLGENLKIKYKDGEIVAQEFKFKNSEHYYFKLDFSNFDLDLFRGLKADGKLTGELRLLDNENDNKSFYASLSDAEIKDLSIEDLKIDKVAIEGSFENNELTLAKLDMTKTIGFLNVSGSFSSLDNFYDKIVDDLKVKIK